MFKWVKGRLNGGYDKLLITTLRWPIPFDLYLLRFPEGSEIKEHVDPVDGKRHYRLNIIIKKAKEGGLATNREPIYENRRIKLFRPDISPHAVSKVLSGTRYVLSLGWVRVG